MQAAAASTPAPPPPEGVRPHPWTRQNIASFPPEGRPPASPPTKYVDRPPTSGWNDWQREQWDRHPSAPPVDPIWSYDVRDYPTGWLRADAIAAGQMFSAAYDAALHLGDRVRRLNIHWHRDDEFNMNMYGRGLRGDIAPDEVHSALDAIIAARQLPSTYTELEMNGLHARIDLIWMRHSRSPARLRVALRDIRIRDSLFTVEETVELADVISEHCLVDFHDVMICVDPRAAVVYGRTRESEGIAMRWPALGQWGLPRMSASGQHIPDDRRSELSGSSQDGSDEEDLPYKQSRLERAAQLYRQAGRDYEKALRHVKDLKVEVKSLRRIAARLTTEASRCSNLASILLDGLRVFREDKKETQSAPVF